MRCHLDPSQRATPTREPLVGPTGELSARDQVLPHHLDHLRPAHTLAHRLPASVRPSGRNPGVSSTLGVTGHPDVTGDHQLASIQHRAVDHGGSNVYGEPVHRVVPLLDPAPSVGAQCRDPEQGLGIRTSRLVEPTHRGQPPLERGQAQRPLAEPQRRPGRSVPIGHGCVVVGETTGHVELPVHHHEVVHVGGRGSGKGAP